MKGITPATPSSSADVLRSGPNVYEAMSNPNFARATTDAPTLHDYANAPTPGNFWNVVMLALKTLSEKTDTSRPDINAAVMPGLPNPANAPRAVQGLRDPKSGLTLDALKQSVAGNAPATRAAPVTFKGLQQRVGGKPPIELWDLTEDIPGHPKGSTLSRAVLEEAGFTVPSPPSP